VESVKVFLGMLRRGDGYEGELFRVTSDSCGFGVDRVRKLPGFRVMSHVDSSFLIQGDGGNLLSCASGEFSDFGDVGVGDWVFIGFRGPIVSILNDYEVARYFSMAASYRVYM